MRILSLASFLALFLALGLPLAAHAAPAYVEVKDCRPPSEEGEFLQTCVKLNVGRRAGRVLGPGWVAPGGQAAAVLQHRQYGATSDRVALRVHGPTGRFEGTYSMGSGGEEHAVFWSAAGRFLAWVEVDGRGGLLRVVDRQRRRQVLSVVSPLEEWPIFAPSGSKLLLPVGRPGDDRTRELCIIDLLVKGSRQTVLQAMPDEELTQPRWIAPNTVQAVRRKVGGQKGKTVQGSFRAPPPPPPPDEGQAE